MMEVGHREAREEPLRRESTAYSGCQIWNLPSRVLFLDESGVEDVGRGDALRAEVWSRFALQVNFYNRQVPPVLFAPVE